MLFHMQSGTFSQDHMPTTLHMQDVATCLRRRHQVRGPKVCLEFSCLELWADLSTETMPWIAARFLGQPSKAYRILTVAEFIVPVQSPKHYL